MNTNYLKLSDELQKQIINDRKENKINPYAFKDENILRRDMNKDKATIWRPAFVRDIEKTMHIPYYNRYSDKTQVFSLYKNDDISRRAFHVQLVSRIARNIGKVLNLNIDLIEAIALAHDIGHTPFGHGGERILSEIYHENTGRYFNHNVHSVRVLDKLSNQNISLQVLDGVLCHNGELEQKKYKPCTLNGFKEFDEKTNKCYIDEKYISSLLPSTLEGCVVRVSDIIAYLGKDRQDAQRLHILEDERIFKKNKMGNTNSEIINNLSVNIIQNSYGKNYLQMDKEVYEALKWGKKENYELIYEDSKVTKDYEKNIKPMLFGIYNKFLKDLKDKNTNSLIYRHHIKYIENFSKFKYNDTDPNDIVVDFIASMTDDYFIDLHEYLFPKSKYKVKYIGYFE